ncbi:MAG: undecaprenyl-diphosphate phosphatase, partial [Clostridiales bacterium]|nr:undecaprenyl-diphosphate phosphatase [Clostridiales bacterium]
DSILLIIVLHLGTLFAVFVAFRKTIWALIKEFVFLIGDIFRGKFKWKEMNGSRRMIFMLIFACVPLLGFYILKDMFEAVASDDDIILEGICFLFTGFILYISTKVIGGRKDMAQMRAGDAFTIGIFQGIALLPGVSRSGSTISSGIFCGLKREEAVKFSFILGIPPILAASALQFRDLHGVQTDIDIAPLVVGFLISAVVGFLAIKLVQWLIKSDRFKIFAVYTLALGIVVIIIGIIEKIYGVSVITQLF